MPTLCFDPVGGAAGDMILAALLDLGADPDEVVRQIRSTGMHEFDLQFERRQDDRKITAGFCDVRVHGEQHEHEHGESHATEHSHEHEHEHGGAHGHGEERGEEHGHGHGHGHGHEHGREAAHSHEHTHEHEHEHEHGHEHEHVHGRRLPEILALLETGDLSERSRDRARRIFQRLAEAEAAVHGIAPNEVHFHEVGAVDSIVDIFGVCIALDLLDVDAVYSTPCKTGRGTVQCAHGLLPLPAPATVKLLEGHRMVRLPVDAELTTPTGAAILTTLSQGSWEMLPIRMLRCGTGHGRRELAEVPNVIRAYLCQTDPDTEILNILQADLDDDTPERIAHVAEQLRRLGARDVLLLPVTMKKGRIGTRLEALFDGERLPGGADALLRESGTIGARAFPVRRYILERSAVRLQTPWGTVDGKQVQRPDGPETIPEYESCRQLAETTGVSLRRIMLAAGRAAPDEGTST